MHVKCIFNLKFFLKMGIQLEKYLKFNFRTKCKVKLDLFTESIKTAVIRKKNPQNTLTLIKSQYSVVYHYYKQCIQNVLVRRLFNCQ